MRYRTVNDGTLRRALNKALKNLEKDEACCATSVDAGFTIPGGQPRGEFKKGYQVFVRVCRYDEMLLDDNPDTGGLVEVANEIERLGEMAEHCDDAGTCKCSGGRRNDGL